MDSYGDANFWLFNVFYFRDYRVWDGCKRLSVAAMQYEQGSQQASAITLNINVARKIREGDYIVAYSGQTGFLGLGKVTKTFYEETNEDLFIQVNGENWRQRIGVEWIRALDQPIQFEENGFKKKLGIEETTVMGSAVIFEISKEGYEFVVNLFERNDQTIESSTERTDNLLGATFIQFVKDRGFNFDNSVLHNYIVALKSKPLVILSGISGTGKTKIAQLFAEYMCPNELQDELQLEAEDNSIVFKVLPYTLDKQRAGWVIPQKKAHLFSLPEEGSSHRIAVSLDGVNRECSLHNGKEGKQRDITFLKDFRKQLIANYQLGDYIKVSLEDGDNGVIVNFTRFLPPKVMKKSKRYLFLSVRPDWIDNKSILGYYNPITEEYQVTELLKLLLRAKDDLTRPYFVVFDEMNLAKVEYYFSDFLSCLESRRVGGDGAIKSESIILHDSDTLSYIDQEGVAYDIPSSFEIPPNIYFTGTVNIDETTYMFSPKVLDRANVIEFNDVDLTAYFKHLLGHDISTQITAANEDFVDVFTDNGGYHKALIKKEFCKECDLLVCGQHLQSIHAILAQHNLHFGYRVIDEVLYYVKNASELKYFDVLEALDYQLLQRILPKMHGNRKKMEAPLTNLLLYCFGMDVDYRNLTQRLSSADWIYLDNYYTGDNINNITGSILTDKQPIFYQTAKKIYRMLLKLKEVGFVSFIE